MTAPRLEIDLDRIHHNAAVLVARLAARGIGVTGVTKATLGSPEIARELLRAGVTALGDSRIENIEGLRAAGVSSPLTLLRAPMPSQIARVVAHVDTSLNTEIDVIEGLARAARAQHRRHGVVLMVELGDLREGILPRDLDAVVRRTLRLGPIDLRGIGTNLACQSGVAPDAANMGVLSVLADSLETTFGVSLGVVSGGNSANLDWAFGGGDVGRVNDLRLGEAILLGREALHRRPVSGLHTDAITLVAEVIEAKEKPTRAWGEIGQTAFGTRAAAADHGVTSRAVLALGRQDVDPAGLVAPVGFEILGASSDHLVVDAGGRCPAVGSEISFALDYAGLLGAMTSPFVARRHTRVSDRHGGSVTAVT